MQNKVPVNEVQIPFKWKDAFDKGSFFGGRISLTIPSFSYEKICVLFNVAAYNSQAASEQNFESEEGFQKAMKKLQIIAGIFAHLKSCHFARALNGEFRVEFFVADSGGN